MARPFVDMSIQCCQACFTAAATARSEAPTPEAVAVLLAALANRSGPDGLVRLFVELGAMVERTASMPPTRRPPCHTPDFWYTAGRHLRHCSCSTDAARLVLEHFHAGMVDDAPLKPGDI